MKHAGHPRGCPACFASGGCACAAAQEVKDDRDDSEDQEQVNQKARCVEDNEAANPGEQQNEANDQKHVFFSLQS
jgi:hypothetical protein